MYTAAAPFALSGPVIAGYLLHHYGRVDNFISVQLQSGFCLLLSAISMAVAIYYHRQELGWEGSMRAALGSAATSNMSIFGNEKRCPGVGVVGNMISSTTTATKSPRVSAGQRDEEKASAQS